MAGLVPAIHVLPHSTENVDARDKPVHDDVFDAVHAPTLSRLYVMLPGMKQRTRGWPSI
jgi:hypothetical protein